MLFNNIGRRFYYTNTDGNGGSLPEGDTPFNLQTNKFYADSEEKFLRSVILYVKTTTEDYGITQIMRLYYDKDCTSPVRPDDLLNMFLKVKIGVINYGTHGSHAGTIYYPIGIENFEDEVDLVMPDGNEARAFIDSANTSDDSSDSEPVELIDPTTHT